MGAWDASVRVQGWCGEHFDPDIRYQNQVSGEWKKENETLQKLYSTQNVIKMSNRG
jgi:hypothetical protein